MRRRIYIPEQVKQPIREHVKAATNEAVETYASAAEDEDAMTGHYGGKLQVRTRRVMVNEAQINGEWKWSIDYYKFGGKGPQPTEHFLGADGIFVLEVSIGSRVDVKCLLFQAKKEGAHGRNLLEQCIKLSTWREAAFIVDYSCDGFRAASIDDVIAQRGGAGSFSAARPLADYLGRDFLDCLVGDDDLRYQPLKKEGRLIWRAENGEIVGTRFPIGHRFKLKVRAPVDGSRIPGIDREIKPEEIHNYRMAATPEEVLGLAAFAPVVSELSSAKKKLATAYHPDHFSNLDPFYQMLMTRRMQEVNRASDTVKEKHKRK